MYTCLVCYIDARPETTMPPDECSMKKKKKIISKLQSDCARVLGVGSQFYNVFPNLIFKDRREGVSANLR